LYKDSERTQSYTLSLHDALPIYQESRISTVLVDVMGKKVAIEKLGSEIEEAENTSIEYINESKSIAGYNTQKAVISDEKGNKTIDRKSTRLNSSHVKISYAVFCL